MILILLSLFAATPFSHAKPVPEMHFRYEPSEQEPATDCTHVQIRDLPDWDVTCETPFGRKTFTAHVIVREYPKEDSTGLEILYWVREPGELPNSPGKYHSTTAFMHFTKGSSLADFSLFQGVENDMASLRLRWKSPVSFRR
ncbi:MAG TPA: hypothetical protein VIH99_02315 [Bdellovibrionota bacterium]|jgi:hypothetical protein